MVKNIKKGLLPGLAYEPAAADKSIVGALRRLQEGKARPHQQKAALDWIIKQASLAYEPAYRAGGEEGRRETDFALGRAFVGQQIVGLLNSSIETEE